MDRRAARRDPAAFLRRLRIAAIIDDVHRAPELVAHIAQGAEPKPVLLGSSRRLSLPITTLRLYHPTRAEREGRAPVSLDMLGHFVPVRGAAPGSPASWPVDRRLLERDIQELVHVRDLDLFDRFYQLALERSGEVLDQQKLARMAGASRTTVVRWLAALDACFLTIRLEPCDYDLGRRLVRGPRLHFLESSSFRSAAVSEIYRNAVHTGQTPDLRYWRDSNGLEVALVVQLPNSELTPVSIVETPNAIHEARLQRWMALAGARNGAIVSSRTVGHQGQRVLRYTLAEL